VGNLAIVSIVDAFIEPIHRDALATWVAACLLGAPVAAFVLATGIKMRSLDNYDFVVAGALVTLLSAAGMFTVVIALPLGIWSLVLLRKPGIRQAFARRRMLRQDDSQYIAGKKIAGPAWLMVAAGLVSVLGPLLVYLFVDRYDRHAFAPALVNLPTGLVMLLGGLAMLRRGPYEAAQAGVIAALLPCGPAWLITLPAGVLALAALRRFQAAAEFSRLVERDAPLREFDRNEVIDASPQRDFRWDDLQHSLRTAARLLTATAALHFAFIPFAWVHHVFVPFQGMPWMRQSIALGIASAALMLGCVILVKGAAHMRRGESWNWAWAASVLALFPLTPAVLLGLPAGLYAIWLLTRPGAAAWFATPGKTLLTRSVSEG
jgi:hypothetical protein